MIMYRILQSIGIIFLLGLMALPASSAKADDGPARKLINSQGCKACHALEGDGGTVGGSFEKIRKTRSRDEIQRQLINPGQRHGNGAIADFSHLSETEIEALVDFMQPER